MKTLDVKNFDSVEAFKEFVSNSYDNYDRLNRASAHPADPYYAIDKDGNEIGAKLCMVNLLRLL